MPTANQWHEVRQPTATTRTTEMPTPRIDRRFLVLPSELDRRPNPYADVEWRIRKGNDGDAAAQPV